MNEVTIQPTELVVEDAMIHALQELKKLKEGQSILSADVDYLKNEQPVNPSICLAFERKDEEKAFDYWNSWEPSANTKLEIKARNGQMSLVG